MRARMQAGDASGTTYYDVYKKEWDAAAMALIDENLHQWVPELIGPNEVRLGVWHAKQKSSVSDTALVN